MNKISTGGFHSLEMRVDLLREFIDPVHVRLDGNYNVLPF